MVKPFTQRELEALVPRMKATLVAAETEAERIDLLGEINSINAELAELKRMHGAEVQDKDTGEKWAVKRGRTAVRSYNTPKLLARAANDLNVPLATAIGYLRDADVLRLTWQYTNLKKFVAENDMTISVAQHEVADGDDEDMGEYWKDNTPRYVKADE